MSSSSETPKKQKRVIVTPPCPPSVATGYLVLRGAALGVIGASMDEATVSLMQPTYIKDKSPTGKFSIGLGKKLGCGELQLPEKDEEVLLDAIEQAANRIIQESRDILTFALLKQEAIALYGEGILDGSHKKIKPQDVVTVAYIEDVVVAVPPALPYASTGSLVKIIVERGSVASTITCGKKARKAEVTLKFRVEESEGGDVAAPITLEDAVHALPLRETRVRMAEGLALLELQQQQAEMEQVTQEIADTVIEDAKDEEMVVNAFEVKGKIDYTKLVDKFGSRLIDEKLLERFEACIKVPTLHRFLRRDIFFSHRDLERILGLCRDWETHLLVHGSRSEFQFHAFGTLDSLSVYQVASRGL